MIICRIGLKGSGSKWNDWTHMNRRDQSGPKWTQIENKWTNVDQNGPSGRNWIELDRSERNWIMVD